MARQSIRAVIEMPKDEFTNFSKGMEYNKHIKETFNPRFQLIKNMEVASDGKLEVRRPLLPHKLDGNDFSKTFVPDKGYDVIKVIHAPFSKLTVPFIWIVKRRLFWTHSDDKIGRFKTLCERYTIDKGNGVLTPEILNTAFINDLYTIFPEVSKVDDPKNNGLSPEDLLIELGLEVGDVIGETGVTFKFLNFLHDDISLEITHGVEGKVLGDVMLYALGNPNKGFPLFTSKASYIWNMINYQVNYYKHVTKDVKAFYITEQGRQEEVLDPVGVWWALDYSEEKLPSNVFRTKDDKLFIQGSTSKDVLTNFNYDDIPHKGLFFVAETMSGGSVALQVVIPEEYAPTAEEIINEGINLYQDNPYFIRNDISGTHIVTVNAINCYNTNGNKTASEAFIKLKPQPSKNDSLILKPSLTIPDTLLVKEFKAFWEDDGKPRPIITNGLNTASTVKYKLPSAIDAQQPEVLTSEYLKYTSPAFVWAKKSITSKDAFDLVNKPETIVKGAYDLKTKPIKRIHLPILLTLHGDVSGEAYLDKLGQDLFKDPAWKLDWDKFSKYLDNRNRPDTFPLPTNTSDAFKYLVEVKFDEKSVFSFKASELKEVVSTTGTDDGVTIGGQEAHWSGFSQRGANNFKKGMTSDIMFKALDTKNSSTIILSDLLLPDSGSGLHKIDMPIQSDIIIKEVMVDTLVPSGTTFTSEPWKVTSYDTDGIPSWAFWLPISGPIISMLDNDTTGGNRNSYMRLKGGN